MTTNTESLPPPVEESLNALLDYLWDDELADYQSRRPAERDGHIFGEIAAIRRWLTAQKKCLTKASTPGHRVPTPSPEAEFICRNFPHKVDVYARSERRCDLLELFLSFEFPPQTFSKI